MADIELFRQVKQLFKEGVNLTKWLSNNKIVMTEALIALIYDLQAGAYTADALQNPTHKQRFAREIASAILRLERRTEIRTILDCGTGEGTTLIPLVKELEFRGQVLGFDASISRASWAAANCRHLKNIEIFVAEMSRIPLADHSIDLVLTVHSLEPNGGKEQELVSELARVSAKYVVMIEPDFESASQEQQIRMNQLGYVKGLETAIAGSNLDILDKVYIQENSNPANRASMWICEKLNLPTEREVPERGYSEQTPAWLDPLSFQALEYDGSWFRSQDGICYPTIDGLPLLRTDDGVLYLSPPKGSSTSEGK
jgi:ubiquinone/menaquinone biosynthesis C-methylase UbiE